MSGRCAQRAIRGTCFLVRLEQYTPSMVQTFIASPTTETLEQLGLERLYDIRKISTPKDSGTRPKHT